MKKILISSAVAVLLFAGCGEDKKVTTEVAKTEVATNTESTLDTVSKAASDITATVKDAGEKVIDNTTAVVSKTTDTVIEKSKAVMEDAKEMAKEVAVSANEKTEEIKDSEEVAAISQKVEEVKEVATEAASTVNKKVTGIIDSTSKKAEDKKTESVEKVEEVKTKVEEKTSSINAKALFAACSACHGQNGELAALGKSQIIKGWDKAKVVAALNGYKDGSYGGVMKGVMKGQVVTKSEEEIDALAEFVSNL